MRLVDELNVVHDSYVIAVNIAVEQNAWSGPSSWPRPTTTRRSS